MNQRIVPAAVPHASPDLGYFMNQWLLEMGQSISVAFLDWALMRTPYDGGIWANREQRYVLLLNTFVPERVYPVFHGDLIQGGRLDYTLPDLDPTPFIRQWEKHAGIKISESVRWVYHGWHARLEIPLEPIHLSDIVGKTGSRQEQQDLVCGLIVKRLKCLPDQILDQLIQEEYRVWESHHPDEAWTKRQKCMERLCQILQGRAGRLDQATTDWTDQMEGVLYG